MGARGAAIAADQSGSCLRAACVRVDGLPEVLVGQMLHLFKHCYVDVSASTFRRDLAAKSHVILIFDEYSRLKGFSTLVLWRHVFRGQTINLLYSGDTVIDRSAWGHPTLPVAFLNAAGALAAAHPDANLYWLLTTKGHRTFRFMPIFFQRFYPNLDRADDSEDMAALAQDIGTRLFSTRYDPTTGVLVADGTSGALAPALAVVPGKDRGRADVRYFLDRNPGYARGDELLCLARMTESNLRPFARRPFVRGLKARSIQ